MKRRHTVKYIHEGHYVAEVDVELIVAICDTRGPDAGKY